MLSADETFGACGRLGRSIAKWPGFCEVSFKTKASSKYVHLVFVDVFHVLCMFMIVYVSCHYRVKVWKKFSWTWKIRCLFKYTALHTALRLGPCRRCTSLWRCSMDHGWPGWWPKIWDLRGTKIQKSMDWFKGNFTGKHHIWWENPWFPVDFPLNQSIEKMLWKSHKIKSLSNDQVFPAVFHNDLARYSERCGEWRCRAFSSWPG